MSAQPNTFKVAQPTRHIDTLRDHPDNPREEINTDDPKIIELAESIVRHGIIEPLVITPDGMLIAGHRRRKAARVAAKLAKNPDLMIVPVTVRADVKPEDALELMLQENMQRDSLTPLEEAKAMFMIMERRKLTVADLARHIAIPSTTCSQRLAILKCEPPVQRLYAANELPLNAAPFLAHVDLAEKQINYAGLLARRQMSLAELKIRIAEDPKSRGKKATSRTETASDIPRPKPVHHETSAQPVTRAAAAAALNKVPNKTISLHLVRTVLDTVCCTCGMQGESTVCETCPLPRFVLGMVGRASL